MFKRVIWWTTGAVAGTVGSRWLERKAKRAVTAKVAALAPSAVVQRVRGVASSRNDATRARIRSAISEGRTAASDREAELRKTMPRR